MLSVIIPSRNERFLQQTVNSLLDNARGEIEVIAVIDENDQELTPREGLVVLKKEGKPGMKSAIMQGVAKAKGDFIMKSDAHCMYGEGFDVILAAECEPNWIIVPRRYSLDGEKWAIKKDRPIIDYEFVNFPWVETQSVRLGGKWYERAKERQDILLDETMTFQGSCYFMPKQHFLNIGQFMPTPTGDDFILDSEEVTNKTWLSGGKVMVNKKTWYAHLHKGKQWGRGYFINKWPMRHQREWFYDYWMNDKWPQATRKMEWLIEHFMPIPHWPQDWKDPKYQIEWRKINAIS
jgi:glycosyltransferase involved in cell wall biosynthesis